MDAKKMQILYTIITKTLSQHIIETLTKYLLDLLDPSTDLSLNTLILVFHKLTDVRQHLWQKCQPLLTQLLRKSLFGLEGCETGVGAVATSEAGVGRRGGAQVFHQRGVQLLVVICGVGGDGQFSDCGHDVGNDHVRGGGAVCVAELGDQRTGNAGEMGGALPEFCIDVSGRNELYWAQREPTILVMLEGLAEHTKGSQPEGLLGLGGTRRV